MQQRTVSLPPVSGDQNGSGDTDTRVENYDWSGQLVSETDERGIVTEYSYDVYTGARTQMLQDQGGLNLETDYEVDDLGRVTQVLGPEVDIPPGLAWSTLTSDQWAVLSVDEWASLPVNPGEAGSTPAVSYRRTNGPCMTTPIAMSARPRVTPSWDRPKSDPGTLQVVAEVLVNPVSITTRDAGGHVIEQIQAIRQDSMGNPITAGPLTSADVFPQSSYCRWTTYQYGPFDRLLSSRVYHNIPRSGVGSPGAASRRELRPNQLWLRRPGPAKLRRTPGGTITRTVFDGFGRAAQIYVGTDDFGATDADPTHRLQPPNNMVLVTEYVYDGTGDAGCNGCNNLTQLLQFVGRNTPVMANYSYDWRNRRTQEILPADLQDRVTYTLSTYDNLDRAVMVQRYLQGPEGQADLLLAQSTTAYDDRGRVYQTATYGVDPVSGAVGNALTGNTWYDPAGNVIKQQAPGTRLFTKTAYDSLNRAVASYVGCDIYGWAEGEVGDVANDTILEQTERCTRPPVICCGACCGSGCTPSPTMCWRRLAIRRARRERPRRPAPPRSCPSAARPTPPTGTTSSAGRRPRPSTARPTDTSPWITSRATWCWCGRRTPPLHRHRAGDQHPVQRPRRELSIHRSGRQDRLSAIRRCRAADHTDWQLRHGHVQPGPARSGRDRAHRVQRRRQDGHAHGR